MAYDVQALELRSLQYFEGRFVVKHWMKIKAKPVDPAALSVMDENKPNTDKLGLETVGLKPGDWLDIDDTCLVKE